MFPRYSGPRRTINITKDGQVYYCSKEQWHALVQLEVKLFISCRMLFLHVFIPIPTIRKALPQYRKDKLAQLSRHLKWLDSSYGGVQSGNTEQGLVLSSGTVGTAPHHHNQKEWELLYWTVTQKATENRTKHNKTELSIGHIQKQRV